MFKILASAFSRLIAAVTSPFRMIIIRIQRMLNINLITAKLIAPLTKKVRSLVTLKPQTRSDYFVVGKWWIYKKLFLTIILVICAGVFIFFTMFAGDLPKAMPTAEAVVTDVEFRYDSMELKDFSGVARILAADGKVVYVGDIEKGVVKGNGTLWDRAGKLAYKGAFDQNTYSGKGVSYYASSKKKYEGDWAENKFNGEGKFYGEGEVLLYEGQFKDGEYDGIGKSYSAQGIVLYEGSFSRNQRHGIGTAYYDDGTLQYSGNFYRGVAQGAGSLYSSAGKLLYNGDMYGGQVNYRSLLNSTFADVKDAFSETPRVFYTDNECVFVYEQMGIIITADCRIRVDTWEKNPTDGGDDNYFYMPGDYAAPQPGQNQEPVISYPGEEEAPVYQDPGYVGQTEPALPTFPDSSQQSSQSSAPETYIPQTPVQNEEQAETSREYSPGDVTGSYEPLSIRPKTVWNLQPMAASSMPEITPVSWYVASDAQTSGSSSQPQQSSEESPRVVEEDSLPEGTRIENGLVIYPDSQTSGGNQSQVNPYPDFVEKNQTIYYEIDTNIWQPEQALEADKVQIKKVTVFTGNIGSIPTEAVKVDDNPPLSVEDCVAIDFIRQKAPTAYSDVRFQANTQNRLFVKISDINFATSINSQAYRVGDLIYRYSYDETGGASPLYFSVER